MIDKASFFKEIRDFFALSCLLVLLSPVVQLSMICANLVRVGRVSCDLFIISHPFRFVKGFCKSFFNFFRGFQSLACPFGFSAEVFDIISRSLVFVKRFFKSFFNFFRDILSAALGFPASQIGLRIISHLLDFVKRFFKSFFNLFRDVLPCCSIGQSLSIAALVDSRCLVDSSHIIALPSPFVKGVF